jgi:hypothetical protein
MEKEFQHCLYRVSTEVIAAQSAEGEPRKCSAQNIFNPAIPAMTEIKFREGPPRCDLFLDEFSTAVSEAERLEAEIVDIQSQIDQEASGAQGRLAPLQIAQILAGYRAWKPVQDRKIPVEVVDRYALKAGIQPHGNEEIPCARLMRAIVAQGAKKGTSEYKRRQKRATTYAGAIDFAFRKGMTEEEFRGQIENPPKKVGQHRGIEHLAAQGRTGRYQERAQEEAPLLPDAMRYSVTGDFAGIESGDYLMLIKIQGKTVAVPGALLRVTDSLIRRALAANAKSQTTR